MHYNIMYYAVIAMGLRALYAHTEAYVVITVVKLQAHNQIECSQA